MRTLHGVSEERAAEVRLGQWKLHHWNKGETRWRDRETWKPK